MPSCGFSAKKLSVCGLVFCANPLTVFVQNFQLASWRLGKIPKTTHVVRDLFTAISTVKISRLTLFRFRFSQTSTAPTNNHNKGKNQKGNN